MAAAPTHQQRPTTVLGRAVGTRSKALAAVAAHSHASRRRRSERYLKRSEIVGLVDAAEHSVEADPEGSTEGDPDDAGAALDVAERDLADPAFDAAVGGVVAVVAHHEHASLLDHEGARALEDGGVLAHQDGMLVAVEVLDVHAGDQLVVR